ncbi:unnamed protein product [Lactuca virosa]|uniref:FBD domain-containing protein n=1 Tax=Lactuca virosa TaxID=75947 RepID=A0AAU9PH84_9ASTR|nr:unnamed protein product [Lactuca virosa]
MRSLLLVQGFETYMPLDEKHSIWSSTPVCMLKCLRTVTLKNFHGYSSEICFIKCVLKYACVLEMMDIWWSTWVRASKEQIMVRVKKELEMMKMSSTACVVKFS